jgi:HPt (histidine-containing phosphotransfer) domain-containing protein
MNESRNLDPVALQRLQRLGGDAFACKMIDLFLEYAAKRTAEARAAHDAGNFVAVEKAVHPLKSSAGNVGASRIQELAARIEALAEQGPSEALAAALGELEQAFVAIKPELEEKRRGFVSPAK